MGMSDEFEQLHFGSPTAGDPAAESDGDGTNNLNEYRAGTNPRNPASRFRILSTVKNSGSVTLTFTSESGKSYWVEDAENLGPNPGWNLLETNISGTGSPVPITDNTATGQLRRFYRVLVLP